MAAPISKTMFNYFTKLPSKTSIVDENPRKLAPVFNRRHVDDFRIRLDEFDAMLSHEKPDTSNYLKSLNDKTHHPFKIDRKTRGPLRARLLQFHEDVRPPYFGTWQKRSKRVTNRRPYHQDDEVFDYDVDSEAEWDIGGPGESLKGDDSEDEEELDDYEIDMKTFVPHGYVSDDEMENSDNEANRSMDDTACDVDKEDDSNSSVRIIGETGIPPLTTIKPPPPPPVPKQTPKMDIKPITLGLNFINNPTLSEAKLQFLQAFEGVSCT